MNILFINPTSDESLNDTIFKVADRASKMSARNSEDYTHNSVIALEKAPKRILTELDRMESMICMMEKVRELRDVYDGFIIASVAELGADAVHELTDKPVVCAGAAGVYPAPLYGHRIAVLGRSPQDNEIHKQTLNHYGILHKNISFVPVYDEVDAPLTDLPDALDKAVAKARHDYLANVIVLADPSMGVCSDQMAKKWQGTVLDGITSAIIRIEYMVFQRAKIEGIWID